MAETACVTGCGRPSPDADVCQRCTEQLATALRDAAGLWPELATTVAGLARMADPGPRPRNAAPNQPARPGLGDPAMRHYQDQLVGNPTGLPFSWAASVDREDIRNEVGGWVRVVVEERYGAGQPQGPVCLECDHPTCERLHAWRRWMPAPVTMTAAFTWLAGQLGWARRQPWAAEAWDSLTGAAQWLTRAVDRPAPRVDAGECLAPTEAGPCRQRLSAAPSAAYVHCPVCRTTQSAVERREVILAGASGLLATAEEITTWLAILAEPTQAATVRRWIARRQLQADGIDRAGRPTYPFGRAVTLRTELWGRRGMSRVAA